MTGVIFILLIVINGKIMKIKERIKCIVFFGYFRDVILSHQICISFINEHENVLQVGDVNLLMTRNHQCVSMYHTIIVRNEWSGFLEKRCFVLKLTRFKANRKYWSDY